MKIKSLIIIACILCSLTGWAVPNPAIARSFNTAVSAVPYNNLIALFAPDNSWKIARNNIFNTYNSAIHVPPVPGAPGWNAGGPTNGWISTNYGCTAGDPADHGCITTGYQDAFFRIDFNLPSSVFTVNWKIFSDNTVEAIYINSMSSPVVTPQTGSWVNGIDFNWCNNWVAGNNFIIIHVRSGPTTVVTKDYLGMMVLSSTVTPINITGPVNVCPNTTNGYSIPTVPGAWSYGWSVPSGWSLPSSSNIISTTSGTNSGLITVNVNGPNGCMGSAGLAVTVLPTPTINISPSASTVCPNTPVTLTASGANTYTWATPINNSNNPAVVSPNSTTVYTVTGTGANGCIGKKTVTITVLPLPSINITAAPPFICPGVSNTLTATGGTSYVWIPSGMQSTSIVVSPVTTTTYGVIGTGTNGCTKTTTIILSPGQPIPITAPNVTLCTNASLCTTLTASSTLSPVNYTWLPIGTGIGSTVVACPTVNTIYTVNATSPAGCSNSITMAVTIVTNCCSQSTVGLTPLTGINSSLIGGSYFVENNITVGGPNLLQNCELLMMPGVKITVPNGFAMYLDRVHFYSCGIKMWQGIEVQDGGFIGTTNAANATNLIEDAEVAIDVPGTSLGSLNTTQPFSLNQVVFNKNYIGIRVRNADPAITLLTLPLTECVFSSRDLPFSKYPNPISWPGADVTATGLRFAASPTTGIVSPYNLQGYLQSNLKLSYANPVSFSNQPAHIGIKIEDVGNMQGAGPGPGVQLGATLVNTINNPAYFNLFDGIGKGIEVTNASLSTANNVFQNMQRYMTSSGMFGGTGIEHNINSLMNARLDLKPISSLPTIDFGNRFWDCWIGVQTKNVFNVDIEYGVFRSKRLIGMGFGPGSDGILLFSNRFRYNVQFCEFNNIAYGLWMDHQAGPYDINGTSTSGTYADKITIHQNYFGPEVTSSTPLNPGTEYSDYAITIKGGNASNWAMAGNCSVLSNKIDRAYRGIKVEKTEDYPLQIGGNNILLKDDYIVNPTADQYGIFVNDTKDNVIVDQNIVTGEGYNGSWNQRLKLIRMSDNKSTNGGSPKVTCNKVSEGYVGFEFEGSQPATVWNNNEMSQKMNKGISLVNQAVIGTQGSNAVSSGNLWGNNSYVAPNVWSSNFQTFADGSSPTNSFSFIWGYAPPAGFPVTNGGPNAFSMGISLGISQIGAECTSVNNYPTLPSQRTFYDLNKNDDSKNVSEEWNVEVYPNPTTGNITISGSVKNEVLSIAIFDLTGKVVYSKSVMNNNVSIDISDLKPSVYLVEIQTKNNKLTRKKLIKIE